MSWQCLITGAILIDPAFKRWIVGDLHIDVEGEVYVFNATGCYWEPIDHDMSVYKAVECGDFFEKNNVIVMKEQDAKLNATAIAYITDQVEDALEPKFPATYCSHCGGKFGPGNAGFSNCDSHAGLRRIS